MITSWVSDIVRCVSAAFPFAPGNSPPFADRETAPRRPRRGSVPTERSRTYPVGREAGVRHGLPATRPNVHFFPRYAPQSSSAPSLILFIKRWSRVAIHDTCLPRDRRDSELVRLRSRRAG